MTSITAKPQKPRAAGKVNQDSQKKRVIRSLFAARWAKLKAAPDQSIVVTLHEVQEAIERANKAWSKLKVKTLSTRNPANFFKDIVRREKSYRSAWPASALKRGYIGMQSKSGKEEKDNPKDDGPCFEFVKIKSTDPIGDLYQKVPKYCRPDDNGAARIFGVQTLELPIEVRRLQREDETFLLQLIVRLRVIETHLGIVSTKKLESLTHLQMGLKLRGAEIDALFLGTMTDETRASRRVLVALEAKGKSDDILKSQIEDQAAAVFRLDAFKDGFDLVVPMAAKLVAPSRIYVVEYRFIARDQDAALQQESEAFYEFAPPIDGLG